MTKQTKKNRPAKPILAWCALLEEDGYVYPGGIIAPAWCCATRAQAREWARQAGGGVIRVEIRPVTAKRKRAGGAT